MNATIKLIDERMVEWQGQIQICSLFWEYYNSFLMAKLVGLDFRQASEYMYNDCFIACHSHTLVDRAQPGLGHKQPLWTWSLPLINLPII